VIGILAKNYGDPN